MNPRECAIYYLEQNALGRAVKLLQEWVLAHPDDVYTHMELIWCFYKRSSDFIRWKDCDQFYEQIYDRPNAQGVRRFVRAEQLYYENNEEESLLHYKAAIDAGLNVPTVHHSMAMALKKLGRDEEAKTKCEIALEQNPRFVPTLNLYGHILFYEGRFDQLERIIQPLDSVDSQSFEYRFRKALNDLDELAYMREASNVFRESVVLAYKDKMSDAIMNLWPIFLKWKDNCWIVRTIVYLFYRAGWLVVGKERIEEVLDSENPIFSYAAGLVLWYEEKHEEALQAYGTAIEKGLEHPLVHCARALVYEILEQDEERECDLVAAFSYAPWCIYAREDLARLRYKQGNLHEVDALVQVTSEEYERAVAYDVSGRYSLARLEQLALSSLLRQGKAGEALSRMRRQPAPCEDEELCFIRAMVCAENEEFGKAALELTKAVRLNHEVIRPRDEMDRRRLQLILTHEPNCFGAALTSALLPAFEDRLEEARENLKQLVRNFPKEPEAWYHLANVSALLGDRMSTKEACHEALAVDNKCKDALLLLCKTLWQEEDVQALRALSQELSGSPEPLIFAMEWAKAKEKPEVAKQLATELLAVEPTNVTAVLYLWEELDPESLEYALMAERLTVAMPIDFVTRSFVARSFLLNGQPKEALQRYDSLFEDGFNSVYTILLRGLAYLAAEGTEG